MSKTDGTRVKFTLPENHYWGRTVRRGPFHIFNTDTRRSLCDVYNSDGVFTSGTPDSDETASSVCSGCADAAPYLADVGEKEPVTDGGENTNQWEQKAQQNTDAWGLQPLGALTLAMGEEMGELCTEILTWNEHADMDRRAEQGRDLIRRMASLGDDIQDHLELVTEDANGEPIPPEERPAYLTPHPNLDTESTRQVTKNELDDLMALGYQFLWSLETPSEGEDAADPAALADAGQIDAALEAAYRQGVRDTRAAADGGESDD